MIIKEEMEKLVEKLNYYTKKYDEGLPEISDREWDEMYFTLKGMEEQTGLILPNSPTQHIDYQVVNELKKVAHNHDMLSLDKTKDMQEVYDFLGNHSFLTMCKMDGLTCSLRYLDGKLVSAETRGNGYIGEDILHNAMVLPTIPKKINYYDELIVDGEIICTYQDFELFADEYRNPRNFASGSIRLLDSKECSKRNLTFVAWDVITGFNDSKWLTEKLQELDRLGFKVVPWVTTDDWDAKEFVQNEAKELGYPIDGLVFKFNNINYGDSLGSTSHHKKNAIAFKFYDEEYETKLTDIEWSMGRTGVFTPVAVFEPVEIDFTWVEKASLHNLTIMQEILGEYPYKGEKLKVFKANMIIPQIASADYNPKNGDVVFFRPKVCPYCGEPLTVEGNVIDSQFLVCNNQKCKGRLLYSIEHFCSSKGLDVKYLSEILIKELMEFGYVTKLEDLFNLKDHARELADKPNWGTRGVKRILDSIETARHTTWDKFVAALGIPLIGTSVAKDLTNVFSSYETFRYAINNNFDFTKLDHFGEAKADAIMNFDYTEADKLRLYLDIPDQENTKVNAEKTLNGITCVITGSLNNYTNRDAMVADIEAHGGKVTGSVSKNTNYLINNDVNSTSSKNEKAKSLGVPIISEADFVKKFLS